MFFVSWDSEDDHSQHNKVKCTYFLLVDQVGSMRWLRNMHLTLDVLKNQHWQYYHTKAYLTLVFLRLSRGTDATYVWRQEKGIEFTHHDIPSLPMISELSRYSKKQLWTWWKYSPATHKLSTLLLHVLNHPILTLAKQHTRLKARLLSVEECTASFHLKLIILAT